MMDNVHRLAYAVKQSGGNARGYQEHLECCRMILVHSVTVLVRFQLRDSAISNLCLTSVNMLTSSGMSA